MVSRRDPPRQHDLRATLIYALVFVIVIADWLTPAGTVVGILLCIPILLSSGGDDRRQVLTVGLAAIVGFIVAAIFGVGPISPRAVWLPNRMFAFVAIATSCVLALLLQRQRLQAELARAQAESARDLGRLLHTLMAHDLRAPLAVAQQALGAVEQPLRSGMPVDLALLADADARLRRSLRATQIVLDAARTELMETVEKDANLPIVDAGLEIQDEVASFSDEARTRDMRLDVELPSEDLRLRIDPAVLRQSVAILVDNALRHANPGAVRISVSLLDRALLVSVLDSGPGLSTRRAAASSKGEGLGLRLCELLAHRAGGSLEVGRDQESGTEFVLRLPVSD